jgi:DNA-binding transcriptional regulator YhcF (GntR family)
MTLTIDPSSPLPFYGQMRERLPARIICAALRPGDDSILSDRG